MVRVVGRLTLLMRAKYTEISLEIRVMLLKLRVEGQLARTRSDKSQVDQYGLGSGLSFV